MLKCTTQNADCSHCSTVVFHMLKVKSSQRERIVISDSKLGNVMFQETRQVWSHGFYVLKIRDLWNVIVFCWAKPENKDYKSEWIDGNRGGRLDKIQKIWGNDLHNSVFFQKINHPVLQNI